MASILIVEDDADTSALLCHWLRALGHEVDSRSNGEQALDALADTSPDLIMIDVHLPGIDGYELVRRIRRQRGSEAAIAMVTITDREDLPADVVVDAWLSKPFSRDDLRRALDEAIGPS